MKALPAVAMTVAMPALLAGCEKFAPDPFNALDAFAKPGYSVTIVSATPDAGGTVVDAAPWLAQIRVTFERPAGMTTTRLVTCLARDTTTFINSSCRDKNLTTQNGEAVGTAGVYSQGNVRAWPETRYLVAFLVSGELVPDLRRHEDEISIRRVSAQAVAGSRAEHPLSWR